MDDSRHRVVATALCVLAPLIGCGGLDSPDPPTNILLISIDALRADHLGCYGYGRATSPFLDDRAAAGIRYANAFVKHPWHPAVPYDDAVIALPGVASRRNCRHRRW